MLFQVGEGFPGLSKGTVPGGGDARPGHKLLGEGFAALQRRACCSRTEDVQITFTEYVCDTGYQRHFWPHDCEINLVAFGKICKLRKLGDAQWDALGICEHAGIPRRGIYTCHMPALCKFPDQGMFTRSRTDDQHPHYCTSWYIMAFSLVYRVLRAK